MGARARLVGLLALSLIFIGSQIPANAATTLTVTQTSNGTISPGTTSPTSGTSQAFTITPSAGYAINTVTVDGVALSTSTSPTLASVVSSGIYTFTNVTTTHTITATYSLLEPASTLGPLFTGAGKLYFTTATYTGLLASYQYSGAAVPDSANRIMWAEVGIPLWLGAAAGAGTGFNANSINPFTITLDSGQPNTANCSIGSTSQAGKTLIGGTSLPIGYARLQATAIGTCNVIVTRATTTNGTSSYQSLPSLSYLVNVGAPCATVTTATKDSIICHIGQKGPGGGIVFYDAGSAGYTQFQARYLEAAPPGWYGKDQPTGNTAFRPDWAQGTGVANNPGTRRSASAGDPLFPICVAHNPNPGVGVQTNPSLSGASDTVLDGTAEVAGPLVSSSYADQSLRFKTTIGSGPGNDSLYRNSMCAYQPLTAQWEMDHSPLEGAANKLWSLPSYGDIVQMIQQAQLIDLESDASTYATNSPCYIDYYAPDGLNYTMCMQESNKSLFITPKTLKPGPQPQQRVSPQMSAITKVTTQAWNITGLNQTSNLPQPGSVLYDSPGFHTIDYAQNAFLNRPIRAFPFYSTDNYLNTANGLNVVGGVSTTNYALTPTYASTTTSYSLSVVATDSSIKVIPQLSDFHSTFTVNGVAGVDGVATSVSLTAGVTTTVDVVITAISGDVKTYTLAVTRPLAAQTTTVTVSNSSLVVPMGGVIATTLTAIGGNGTGAYSFSSSTANCSITGNQLTTTLSSGSCSVTATRLGDSSYAASSASAAVSFTVTTAGIVPTFDTPVSTSSGFTVNVTNYATGTTFTPTITAGSVSAGTASGSTLPLTITGRTTGQSATVTVTTTKANTTTQSATVLSHALYSGPAVTAVLASASVGTTLSPTFTVSGLQGSDAITSVSFRYAGTGSTTYGPSATAPSTLGTYSVTPSAAVFSPTTAASEYAAVSYTAASFSITALSRTISFTSAPTSLTFNSPVTVVAAPTAGTGTITYTSSNTAVCTISGNQVTAVAGSGTCTVTATIASDGTYAQVSVTTPSITMAAASRSLSFTSAPTTLAYGGTGTVVATVGLGGGTVSYSAGSSTACSVGSSTGAITVTSGTGTCLISATITADANYVSVSTTTSATITITLGNQATLTITSAATKGFINSYSLTSSGGTTAGAVIYVVSASGNTASCSITGTALTTTGAVGTSCLITATMAGNLNYQAVTSAGFTVTIVKSYQAALLITSSPSKPFSSALALTTSGGSGTGTISFAVTTAGAAGCSITGSSPNFSLQSTGAIGTTCGITATSVQTTNYFAVSSSEVTFTVRASKPTPPLITSVSPGDSSVTVSWTAPSDFGGSSQIDTYTVTSIPGGFTCTTVSLSCTVTGLTNGASYTFKVSAATIGGGTSDLSTESSSITPVTKAAAVTALTVATGDTQLTVNWKSVTPATLGGGTFTSYLVYYKAHSSLTYGTPWATITDSSTTTSLITGLTNGTAYDVKVVTLTAANATEINGNAAEALQTPAAPPSAPRQLTAFSADGITARVSWQIPLSDGGDIITAYNVTVLVSSVAVTCTLATPTSTSCTLTSLTRGTSLSISVKARNLLMGQGVAATLVYLLPNMPGKPTWGSAVASPTTGNAGTIALNWSAPVNTGDRPITSYSLKTINRATNSIIDTQTVYSPFADVPVSDIAISFAYYVFATNEIGDGQWSESLTVTTTLPGSVTFGDVTYSPNLMLTVTVANDGGSPITGYLYSIDGINYDLINSPASPISIPNLTPGASYRIYVKAKNIVGSSTANSITVVIVQGAPSGGGGGSGGYGGGGGSGQTTTIDVKTAIQIATDQKAAVDKALAEKAAADKIIFDKVAAEKAAADKAAADKVIADKLAADTSAAAAQFKSTCDLAQGSTIVTPKSSKMKIYSQICFVPDLLKPVDKDLALIKGVISDLKKKKIKSITLSSFADERNGVDFKSVATARAEIVSGIIQRSLPNIKVNYKLYGSSTKKNSLSLGRVLITAQ
ncbi:Fibronectin type III [Candidatus Nanopelagicaceae bacterium]